MDVVIARQGNCCQDMEMALKYTVGKEYSCELMGYVKVKALEITSTTDEVIMLDGEVFPGPNPFRFVTIPSLLTVFGEYSSVCLTLGRSFAKKHANKYSFQLQNPSLQ